MSDVKNILVTGGAGYIGSHTCKELSKNGFTPVVYDNLSRGHKEFVKWGQFVQGDILDTKKLTETLQEYKIVAVLHFAALAYVGESCEKPDIYYRNNLQGTLSLLEAMRTANVRKLVFSSTCATYGIPKNLPIDESTEQNPINPYGQSKLMIEKILKDFAKAYDLKAVCLRYFNAAGADQDGDIGENHNPETHLVPLAILSALKGTVLKVFGTDYPTPDGTCVRDYIHVSDLAAAHVLALKNLNISPNFSKGKFSVFNLGNQKGFSVKEIIQAVEKVSNKKSKTESVERRPGDPAKLIASAEKAKKTLGWTPQFDSIEKIIQTAYNWHQKNH